MSRWPFSKRNRELRAYQLDRMSEMKCSHMNANAEDALRVSLEDNHFVVRKNGAFVSRYLAAALAERHLRGYYRELIYKTSVWSE